MYTTVSPVGRRLENSTMPGISKRGSQMFTQKCGVTERFSRNTTQTTPMLAMAS